MPSWCVTRCCCHCKQRAWRCFYARITLYYLREHRKYMKVALKAQDVQRIGCVIVPHKYVRQYLRSVLLLRQL